MTKLKPFVQRYSEECFKLDDEFIGLGELDRYDGDNLSIVTLKELVESILHRLPNIDDDDMAVRLKELGYDVELENLDCGYTEVFVRTWGK